MGKVVSFARYKYKYFHYNHFNYKNENIVFTDDQGKIFLPHSICTRLNIKPGDRLLFTTDNGHLVISKLP